MHDIRPEKAGKVAELKDLLSSSKGAVLVDYCGLTVAEDTELRSKMREAGVKYMVAKNTFIRIAAKEAGIEGLDAYLEHNTAVAFSAEDPVAPAKVMANFAKTNPQLVIKAGAMPNNVLDVAGVEKLATMPSRDELLAKLMATMNEPVAKFVRTLNEVPARFVRTLAAVRDAKEQAAA